MGFLQEFVFMTNIKLTPDGLWDDVLAVREKAPLVHNITNFVAMNISANTLLALGAAPVMAHAHEEVADMVTIAQALVLNIGTLEPDWVRSMQSALVRARERHIPVVLDPVGAGATAYRNRVLSELISAGAHGGITVLRGNGSEILSVTGLHASTRGVYSTVSSDAAVTAAQAVAWHLQGAVCVSGADDHVVDERGRWVTLSNGHAWMTRITGMGCSASALIGAFVAVQPDAWRATVAATAYLGVVGEVAAEQTQREGGGVGTMQVRLLDGLQLLDRATFVERLKLVQHS